MINLTEKFPGFLPKVCNYWLIRPSATFCFILFSRHLQLFQGIRKLAKHLFTTTLSIHLLQSRPASTVPPTTPLSINLQSNTDAQSNTPSITTAPSITATTSFQIYPLGRGMKTPNISNMSVGNVCAGLTLLPKHNSQPISPSALVFKYFLTYLITKLNVYVGLLSPSLQLPTQRSQPILGHAMAFKAVFTYILTSGAVIAAQLFRFLQPPHQILPLGNIGSTIKLESKFVRPMLFPLMLLLSHLLTLFLLLHVFILYWYNPIATSYD